MSNESTEQTLDEREDHLDQYQNAWSTETAIATLTITQLNFLNARLWHTSDKAAAVQINIKPSTVYSWPKKEKEALRWLIQHYTSNAIQTAQEILTRSLVRAVLVKIAGLDHMDEATRQHAATEIMDRVIGKPRYAFDITTNQPTLKTYVNVSPDMWDEEEEDEEALPTS